MTTSTKKHGRRLVEPRREQAAFHFEVPDDAIASDHPARIIWMLVQQLDLTKILLKSRAVEGSAGRPTISPAVKLALWLYGISEGVGSAREIERLVHSDIAFRWIAGGIRVSHHVLSAFRVEHGREFDELFSNVIGTLLSKGLISLATVAQDGTRVRASASPPSFRTEASLLACKQQAELHLKAVIAAANDPERSAAQHAASLARANEMKARVDAAIETVRELQKDRDPRYGPARASTTDASARTMKMGDSGFRPAFNVQFATVGEKMGGPRTIVGVRVTTNTTDMGSLEPMLEEIRSRTDQLPKRVVADAGHAKHSDIAASMRKGVDVIVSVPDDPRLKTRGARSKQNTTEEIVAWRSRMEQQDAKEWLRWRGSACELSNAHVKQRFGMRQFLVRGIEKVTCVVLLTALAANLLAHASALLS